LIGILRLNSPTAKLPCGCEYAPRFESPQQLLMIEAAAILLSRIGQKQAAMLHGKFR
jgi:hypothetical protein